MQLQWGDVSTTMTSAVKYSVQRDNTTTGRKGSAPNSPRATAPTAAAAPVAAAVSVLSDINSAEVVALPSQDENRLHRSSTATTIGSTTTTLSSGSSRAGSVGSEVGAAAEQLGPVGGGGAAGGDWQERERLYQKELSQLRDAILQLEMDRQEAISR